MLLASAGGNRVPVIPQLVQANEDTVRDVIHRVNEIGLACLDLGGREGVPVRSVLTTGLRRPDGRHPPDQARPALHPLLDSQIAPLSGHNCGGHFGSACDERRETVNFRLRAVGHRRRWREGGH